MKFKVNDLISNIIVIIIILGVAVGLAVMGYNYAKMTDIEDDNTTLIDSEFSTIHKINIEGHDYIYTEEGGIVHSESCPCKITIKPSN